VGSNPTLSATEFRIADFELRICEGDCSQSLNTGFVDSGLKSEIRNSQSEIHRRRGARVVELAALEML
jgi:hypothetical protein